MSPDSPAPLLGLLFGIASALIWGTGDFAGGLASRRYSPFQVLALVSLTGLALFLLLAWLTGGGIPPARDWAWSAGAGLSGAIGIAALYRGLSLRTAAIVAPTAAVVGTALPVLAGLVLQGNPGYLALAGFAAGGTGIWLVSRSPGQPAGDTRLGLGLAVLAGLLFGGFFVLIAQVEHKDIFAPLAIAKGTAVLVAFVILYLMRLPLPSPRAVPLALVAGLFDAGGNVFYLLAARYSRLDVAAVLSAMAPAVTVLLSSLVLSEQVRPRQWAGVGLCVLAIALLAS
jgi:drug/metabolite transporter (DMT)-like permease